MLALKILVSVKQTLTIQLREVGDCSANLLRILNNLLYGYSSWWSMTLVVLLIPC